MANIIAQLADKMLNVPDEQEEKEAWRIKDDLAAEFALDKIREAQADYRRFEMVVSDKIAQLQSALQAEKEGMEREINFFQGKLAEYFETVPRKVTKTQETYKLPSGRLVKKYKAPKIERDNETLVAWLEQNNMTELVKIEKKADWATLKKETEIVGESVVSKHTGEVIEGITAVPQNPEFKVEV